jgi:negative regulator of flagellin synthesis FlgM
MAMKISSDGIDKINSEFIQRDLKRIKDSEEEPSNIDSDDKVELSSKALDLKEMQGKALSFPDIRPEKVEQIKMQVENGTYKISTEKIAERLIEDAMEVNA